MEARIERELATLEAEFETELHTGSGSLRTEPATTKAEIVRWMFLFWIGTVGSFIAAVRIFFT